METITCQNTCCKPMIGFDISCAGRKAMINEMISIVPNYFEDTKFDCGFKTCSVCFTKEDRIEATKQKLEACLSILPDYEKDFQESSKHICDKGTETCQECRTTWAHDYLLKGLREEIEELKAKIKELEQ